MYGLKFLKYSVFITKLLLLPNKLDIENVFYIYIKGISCIFDSLGCVAW